MIVKWLGMRWYLGPPEDEGEDVPERWVVFGLQVATLAIAAMLWGKMMAAEIAAADNPLIHYQNDSPDPETP